MVGFIAEQPRSIAALYLGRREGGDLESIPARLGLALRSKPLDEDLYDAKVTVLMEYVKHHVKEEEGELFPKVKKSGLDLNQLGAELAERKQELMSDDDEEGWTQTEAR